jgi:hypothetical protein
MGPDGELLTEVQTQSSDSDATAQLPTLQQSLENFMEKENQ